MDLTFGLGITAMAVVAVILLGVGYFAKKEVGAKVAKFAMVLGIGALVLTAGAFVMVNQPASSTTQVLTPESSFNSICSASTAHTSIQNNSHVIVIAMTYNSTSKLLTGSTDVTALNFTVSRADTGIDSAVATCSLGNVPIVGIVGSTAQPIVAVNSDNTYKASFAKLGGFSSYGSGTVLVAAGSSAWMTCTLTLNSAALAGMSLYQIEQIPLNIGGQSWVVNAQLISIST